jgi:hypothetical protein
LSVSSSASVFCFIGSSSVSIESPFSASVSRSRCGSATD